ncbi:hypothetical protein GCM10027088_02930 [Nocardia goodfellowii]
MPNVSRGTQLPDICVMKSHKLQRLWLWRSSLSGAGARSAGDRLANQLVRGPLSADADEVTGSVVSDVTAVGRDYLRYYGIRSIAVGNRPPRSPVTRGRGYWTASVSERRRAPRTRLDSLEVSRAAPTARRVRGRVPRRPEE